MSYLLGIWKHKALHDVVEREDDLVGTDNFEGCNFEDGGEEEEDNDDDGEKVEDADRSDESREDEEVYDGGEYEAEIDEVMEASDAAMDELLKLAFQLSVTFSTEQFTGGQPGSSLPVYLSGIIGFS
ncbi:hypothetical protein VE00_10775 [Pseudogymnoascus sp. WSF 3629]|nr:hypothetical protein VE00_10775 [Pseudogymnoascus sp. WSF 3629]